MNIASAICAAVVLLAGDAAADDGGKVIQKTTISLGTATPGGGFPLYGNAFAETMNEADPTLSIEPRALRCGSSTMSCAVYDGKAATPAACRMRVTASRVCT